MTNVHSTNKESFLGLLYSSSTRVVFQLSAQSRAARFRAQVWPKLRLLPPADTSDFKTDSEGELLRRRLQEPSEEVCELKIYAWFPE